MPGVRMAKKSGNRAILIDLNTECVNRGHRLALIDVQPHE